MLEFSFVELKYTSDRAILVDFGEEVGEPIWLPKSQIDLDKDTRVVYVKQWLAKEKGLTEE